TAHYVTGTVRDADGNALPGTLVTLSGCNDDCGELLARDAARGLGYAGIYATRRECRTDTLGRFHFADLPGGVYAVESFHEGSRAARPVEVSGDPPPFGLTIL